jgi:carotenoid 1,2-hydratase
VSDDGRASLVVIALLGSPFSPRYAQARARGESRPLDHCALHVALEAPGLRMWSLAERTVAAGDRGADAMSLGRSRVHWSGDSLRVDIHERTTPGGAPLRGSVALRPEVVGYEGFALDAAGDHRWHPVAPVARVEVDLREPPLRFRGHGYADANAGRVALESTFAQWSWSRARLRGARAAVTYDVVERGGSERAQTHLFAASGGRTSGLGRAALPATRWGLERRAGADDGWAARVARSLEDGPCYARSLVATRVFGEDVTAMHEVLSGDRLRRAWVRFLLGFRIGRQR